MPTESNENREQNKALEFWEGMFGDLTAVNAHGKFIHYKEFIRRFDSVLEQERLQSQIEILNNVPREFDVDGDPYVSLTDIFKIKAVLEQKLKTLKGEQ